MKYKLNWIFKPPKGNYPDAIIYALDALGRHYGHVAIQTSEVHGLKGELHFFGTAKVTEDKCELGGEVPRKTIQEAMDDLQYHLEHREYPKDYYAKGS